MTEGGVNPAQIDRLPAPIHDAYISSFTDALHVVFLVAACVVLVAFALSWLIEERPLRATVETASGTGEVIGGPVDTDSLREVTRGLTRLVGRERTMAFIASATRHAGVDLDARSRVAAPVRRSAGRTGGPARDPRPAARRPGALRRGAGSPPRPGRDRRRRPHHARRPRAARSARRGAHRLPARADRRVAARRAPGARPAAGRLAEELGEQPHDGAPALAPSATASRDD